MNTREKYKMLLDFVIEHSDPSSKWADTDGFSLGARLTALNSRRALSVRWSSSLPPLEMSLSVEIGCKFV